MPYTESDPGSPPPLESVLPSAPSASSAAVPPHLRDDRSQLDFSSISSYSTLQKIKTMRKEEGKIEDQIRRLEKQLGMVKKEQSAVRGEIAEHPPVKFGPLKEERLSFGTLKPKKKPRSSRSTNVYSLKLTQYEPHLICPLYRCTFLPPSLTGPSVKSLDYLLLSIFQLSSQITLDQYLPVLMDLLRDEMLEKMTPTMFAIPYNEQFEETIRTVAGGVLPRSGNEYAEWGTVCAFMADLIPTIFNEALGQINAAMSRSPAEPKNVLPNGDTCICALSSSHSLLKSLESRLLVLSTSLSSQRLRNARSLDLKSWIRWIETQHTLGRFDPVDWGVFQPDSSCLPWQRKVSKALSFIQSGWDEAVGQCEREELVRPLMECFEYLGGVQLFEQAKRWRVESGGESKSDAELDMGGSRMLLELPYFKNESVRLEEGTPKHTKELGDTLSKTDFQKAAQYYDSAALTSLPLFTARTNAALMRLQHDTPRELERAVSDCEVVLRFEPENWKALNRRGRAYAGLGWYKYALADLERAVELQPGNKDFESERDRIKGLWDMYRRKGEK